MKKLGLLLVFAAPLTFAQQSATRVQHTQVSTMAQQQIGPIESVPKLSLGECTDLLAPLTKVNPEKRVHTMPFRDLQRATLQTADCFGDWKWTMNDQVQILNVLDAMRSETVLRLADYLQRHNSRFYAEFYQEDLDGKR
jgi:hypothetical protein